MNIVKIFIAFILIAFTLMLQKEELPNSSKGN